MNKENYGKIAFLKHMIEESVFKINNNYNSNNEEIDFNFDFNREIDIDKENAMSLIKIDFEILDKDNFNRLPFYMKVSIVGFFSFESDLSKNDLKEMLEINGTAILFPYLRSFITTLTSNAGIPPLVLPTLNIQKIIEEKNK